MPYGGLIPLKTDATTPLIADVCETDFQSIKIIHVPTNVSADVEKEMYKNNILSALNIESTFFDVGSTEYPIFVHDYSGGTFSTQFFKLNTIEKINAFLRLFHLFAKRDIADTKLMKSYYDMREAFTDKLTIVASGTKYDNDVTTFWMNFDLIGGYSNDVSIYKQILLDNVNMLTGIDLNTSDYLSWITYELYPAVTPTMFRVTFIIDTVAKLAIANQVAQVMNSGYCCSIYELLYDVCGDILAY
jgi:hypothetical protein